MSSATQMITDTQTSEEMIRVYCTAHNLGFSARRESRVLCESGHELDLNFPYGEYWDYCCDCQTFVLSNFASGGKGAVECVVCDRKTIRRFVCGVCKMISVESDNPGRRKLFSFSAQGSITPACPGCQSVSVPGVVHDCADFGSAFVTPRAVCPFCDTALELPPTFPCSVAAYIEKLRAKTLALKFEPESNTLRESPAGDYLLIEKAPGSALPFVIPKAVRLSSKQDYYNTYQEFFDCDNAVPGEVIIRSPALVEKCDQGWRLREPGILEIKADKIRPATTAKTERMITCGVCGANSRAEHRFCKSCGSPMSALAGSQPVVAAPQRTTTASTGNLYNSTAIMSDQVTARLPYPNEVVAPSPLPVTSPSGPGKVIGAVIGGIVLAAVLISIIVGVSVGRSVEAKLDSAITRGNLYGPGTENAHDLYSQLKSSGASEDTLKRYREKLTPLLTAHGNQLTTSLMQIGYDEPDASEWQDAVRDLNWAAELNAGNGFIASRAAYCEGRAAYLQKRLDQALSSWSRAADLDKSWVLPTNGIGMIYLARKNYSTARTYFGQASQRDPKWPFPDENMGNTYWEEKNYLAAAQCYRQALEKDPQWAKPHYHLGDMAWEAKDYASAVTEYQAALDPNSKGLKPKEVALAQKRLEAARQHLPSM